MHNYAIDSLRLMRKPMFYIILCVLTQHLPARSLISVTDLRPVSARIDEIKKLYRDALFCIL